MSSTSTLRPPRSTPNVQRLATDIEPDLARITDGLRVECYFTPMLARPERAVISIHHGNVLLDQVNVPAADGFEMWAHPAVWSDRTAEALA